MNKFIRCSGSGGSQMIDWPPDLNPDVEFGGKPYPGAVVCLGCSFGVLIVKGSDHDTVSQSGYEGRAGKVRIHYVTKDRSNMSYKKDGS